ncbi:MAG: hypothetical protein A2X68_02085 [Ignavibacteria bacterium GWC2_56_12]|nr:MAG: hypothetical protein A2X68_02085 [Ignavibacteria bacterium GWC2_56_12]
MNLLFGNIPTRKSSTRFALLLLIVFAPPLQGQKLYSLQTKRMNLVSYDAAASYVLPHVGRCFENAISFHEKLFGYQCEGQIAVLLNDFNDFGNGAAGVVPQNLVSLGMSPISMSFETLPSNERFNWIMNHELVHIVSLDQAAGRDRFFRSIFFGKVSPKHEQPLSMIYSYYTAPRTYSTRWYREGLAVFIETWMAGGLGRALGSYDEMVFRTMVRDSAFFYDPIGLESEGTKVDFQVGANAYLYGTRFMTYLVYTYGPAKFMEWIRRVDGSEAHYAAQFEKVYGRPMDEEWETWIAFEHTWQNMNLDSIRTTSVTPVRPITHQVLGSVSRSILDSSAGVLYAGVNYPGQVAHLAAISLKDGNVRPICEVTGGALYDVTSLAYDPVSSTLFYTTNNNSWRNLESYNLKTGKRGQIMHEGRVGDIVFRPEDRSLWGIRHFNGIATIVRIPPPYNEWKQVHSFPYGKVLFDIDISPDGKNLSGTLTDERGRQQLVEFSIDSLLSGNAVMTSLFDFENSVPASFVYAPRENAMYGTSYFTGVSNVYRYDRATKEMDIVTNSESGFFRPIPYGTDSLIVFAFSGKGFVPSLVANRKQTNVGAITFLGNSTIVRYPELQEWNVGSPARVPFDSLTTFDGAYSPMSHVSLVSAYPMAEGYKDAVAAGWRFNFADRLYLNTIDVDVSYSSHSYLKSDERLHVATRYRGWGWTVTAAYNGADFYDLFGPVKTGRKGYWAKVEKRSTLLFNEPEILESHLSVAGYGGLERLPEAQNIAASFDRMYTISGGIQYKFLRKSLGGVEDEKGTTWYAHVDNRFVRSQVFTLLDGGFDIGIPLPLGHSSIWLRSAAGTSFGGRSDPFANFYFGGFGNNYVDYRDSKRYRETGSFPGLAIDGVGGGNFGKGMVEWVAPPIRFRRFGLPKLYASFIHCSAFLSGIVTNADRSALRASALSAGVQADVRLVAFSSLDATFSVGYAIASESGNRTDEVMASLRIQ